MTKDHYPLDAGADREDINNRIGVFDEFRRNLLVLDEAGEAEHYDMAVLHTYLDNAAGRDPSIGLGCLGQLLAWLAEREEALVLAARVEGMSWAQIAGELGRSKQAVWEKHRDPDDAYVHVSCGHRIAERWTLGDRVDAEGWLTCPTCRQRVYMVSKPEPLN